MPRIARQQSDTGVYHAILRGVNKQQIFECPEDYHKFLQILRAQTLYPEDALGQKQPPHCTSMPGQDPNLSPDPQIGKMMMISEISL